MQTTSDTLEITEARNSGCARVLVIDDEPSICEVLSMNFALNGYEVSVANSGADGLYETRVFQPDVVVLDLMMPGLNGYEVASLLRQLRPNLPVLFVSAVDSLSAGLTALGFDNASFVSKPFALSEITVAVEALLNEPREGELSRCTFRAPSQTHYCTLTDTT